MGPITFNKLQEGNSHLSWICSLIRICILKGIHYWLENPDSSHMWYQPEILTLPNNACQRFYRVDFCAFKTPWRKRSRFLTSGRLANTKKLCTRDHRHIVLRGRSSRHGKCWTKVAQAYPTGLCAMLAWSACADTGLLRNRHVTIGEVAKCCGNRIGEASHPGPRRPTAVDFRCQNPLSSVELIRPETTAFGLKQWELFSRWFLSRMPADIEGSFWACPQLLGHAIAQYGYHLYESGGALHSLRHLLTHVQRAVSGTRGHLGPAWEVVSKW